VLEERKNKYKEIVKTLKDDEQKIYKAIIPYSPFFALLESCISRSSGAFIFTDKVLAMFSPYLLPQI
jgi:hypothetical protein